MPDSRPGSKTSPGFADPNIPVVSPGDGSRDTPVSRVAQAPPEAATAGADAAQPAHRARVLEVEVTHEHGPAPRDLSGRPVYEIWTQNNVYALDSRLFCIEVRKRGNDARGRDEHPLIGARLVGGQVQGESMLEMSHPFPRPGALAVFEARKGKRRQFPRTSPVERVVVRVHIATITDPDYVASWDDVSLD